MAVRFESIDRFRGFAVVAMIAVNVLGRFPALPETFRHARFERLCLADAVAPFFFFVVGIGFRLSFLRHRERLGAVAATRLALKRFLLLTLIALVIYRFEQRRIFWDALTQIAFGSLLALPVIGSGAFPRVVLPFAYAGVLLAIGRRRLFGVPFELESASWPLMILAGSIAADRLDEKRPGYLLAGGALAVLGAMLYDLTPATVPACALAYLGASLLLLEVFRRTEEVPLPHLATFGRNALLVYALHLYLEEGSRRLVPADAGPAAALGAFALVYLGCYAPARFLQRRGRFLTV